MQKYFFLGLFLSLTILACKPKTDVKAAGTAVEEKVDLLKTDFDRSYVGFMDGQNVLTLKVTKKGTQLTGKYVFGKGEDWQPLSGTIDSEGNFTMKETTTAGLEMATWKGSLTAEGVTGTSMPVKGEKGSTFDLKDATPITEVEGFTYNGTYKNEFTTLTVSEGSKAGTIDVDMITKKDACKGAIQGLAYTGSGGAASFEGEGGCLLSFEFSKTGVLIGSRMCNKYHEPLCPFDGKLERQ